MTLSSNLSAICYARGRPKMTIEKDNGDEKKEGGISVLHPEKNEFIQFQDAEVWYKYFRANYGVCLSDALMKDQDDFGNRVRKQVETELNQFNWEGLSREFYEFKNDFQDVDLFLTDKDLNFLFDEPRFVNYCWCIFCSELEKIKSERNRYKSPQLIDINLERYLKKDCINNEMRRENIILCMQCYPKFKGVKKDLILELRNEWARCKFKDISWIIKDDDENNEWIFDALASNEIMGEYLIPEGATDYYWLILMLLDFEGDTNYLHNLISKLRKSLSQRKYRAKNQDLKYYSIAMTAETKQKLDSIVAVQETKIHRVIERLINQEYDKK